MNRVDKSSGLSEKTLMDVFIFCTHNGFIVRADSRFFTVINPYLSIPIEERDLIDYMGDHYREYRSRVPALIPMPGKGVKNVDEVNAAVEQTGKVEG